MELIYVYGICDQPTDLISQSPKLGKEMSFLNLGSVQVLIDRVNPEIYNEATLSIKLQDLDWLAEKAQIHHHVIDSLFQEVSILPFKFGTIYQSLQSLTQALAPKVPEFYKTLIEMKDCQEWALRIYQMAPSCPETVTSHPDWQALEKSLMNASRGKAFLLQKKKANLQKKLYQDYQISQNDLLGNQLRSWCKAVIPGSLGQAQPSAERAACVGHWILLVQENGQTNIWKELKAQEKKLQNKGLSWHFEVSGPWPPYHFIPML